jgi:hypothetical protein
MPSFLIDMLDSFVLKVSRSTGAQPRAVTGVLDTLFILHSGQTGVERGADEGARAAGLPVAGFMPPDCRDELGRIPNHIALDLTTHHEKGFRPAVMGNLEIASAAILVVPDAQTPAVFTATSWLLNRIRAKRCPMLVCDPRTSLADAASWAKRIPESCGSVRLLVTGLRATRWDAGHRTTRRIVIAIGTTDIDKAPGSLASQCIF